MDGFKHEGREDATAERPGHRRAPVIHRAQVKARLAASALLLSTPVWAADPFVGATSEISGRSSTESTRTGVREAIAAEDEEARERERKRAGLPAGAACTAAKDCKSGICEGQRCVGPVENQPAPAACRDGASCGPGQSCVDGRCATAPPTPPVSLHRRSTELLLRDRSAQLRQELALGGGPLLATLALGHRASPAALGRLLRAHHRELGPLIAEPTDPLWPARFLDRVDALVAETGAAQHAQRK